MLLFAKLFGTARGTTSWAFYALAATGFTTLLVFAVVQRDWTVATIAAVMVAVVVIGAPTMRRLQSAAHSNNAEAPDER